MSGSRVTMPDSLQTGLDQERERLIRRFHRASQWCGVASVVAGTGMALLWLLQPTVFVEMSPAWLMKANSALALTCLGASLALSRSDGGSSQQRVVRGLAVAGGLIGLVSIVEYVAKVDFGVDALFV